MAPVEERVRLYEHEHQHGDRDASSHSRSAPPHDEAQGESGDDDRDERRRDDRGKPKAREIDACHTQDPGQHQRRAEAGRHREESAKALALAGLFASVPPGHERVETREERGAERGRDDDTGRHRIRRDRIEAERCATES